MISRRYLYRLAAVTIATSGAVTMSACGGSSKTAANTTSSSAQRTTTATKPPSPPATNTLKLASGSPLRRSEWIARGEAICARTNTKLSAISVKTIRDYVRVFPQIAIYEHTEAQELSRLVPPRAKVHDWARIVNELQLVGDYADKLVAYLQAKNERVASSSLSAAEDLHQRLNAIARHDGFKECAQTRVHRR